MIRRKLAIAITDAPVGFRYALAATVFLAVTPVTSEASAAPATKIAASLSETYAAKVDALTDCDDLGRTLNSLPDPTPLLRSVFQGGIVIKNEFETSSEFASRIHNLLRGKLGGTSLILAREKLKSWQFRYDADTATMHAQLLFVGRSTDHTLGYNAHVELPPTYVPGEDYVGSNSFGARRAVTKGNVYNLSVSFDDAYFRRRGRVSDWQLPMDAASAKALKLSAEIVLLGRSVPPYLGTGGTIVRPTFDDPIEGMVLDHEVFVAPLCVFLASQGRMVYRFIDRSSEWQVTTVASDAVISE